VGSNGKYNPRGDCRDNTKNRSGGLETTDVLQKKQNRRTREVRGGGKKRKERAQRFSLTLGGRVNGRKSKTDADIVDTGMRVQMEVVNP